MKIVAREIVPPIKRPPKVKNERLVKENLSEIDGLREVNRLNATKPLYDEYYILVEDDYKLVKTMS